MARKNNTRRRARRHVLDVKLSSNQVRRRRTQLLVSAVFAVAFLTATIYGLWRGGWWAAQKFVYKNDQLRIQEFVIRTDGVIGTNHLYRWAGVKAGENLFAVDLHAIKRRLEMNDMIRKASLERGLPSTLRLLVAEREPIAQVKVQSRDGKSSVVLGVDHSGYAMMLDRAVVRPETVKSWEKLPLLTGFGTGEVPPGKVITNRQAHAALEFISSFNASDMMRHVRLASINISEPEILNLLTTEGNNVLFLDRGFERQLARWRATHVWCASKRVRYTWVDFSPTNHVPIKLVPLIAANTLSQPTNP